MLQNRECTTPNSKAHLAPERLFLTDPHWPVRSGLWSGPGEQEAQPRCRLDVETWGARKPRHCRHSIRRPDMLDPTTSARQFGLDGLLVEGCEQTEADQAQGLKTLSVLPSCS